MNVDKDSQTIKDDIMPGLMRNQTLRFNRFGVIEEREDDELEDVLHPDAQDKATEEVEKHVERMADMQRKGSDIFFGGFSQMKRFPFFDAMANWLLPFTLNHPDLTTVREKIEKFAAHHLGAGTRLFLRLRFIFLLVCCRPYHRPLTQERYRGFVSPKRHGAPPFRR